MSRLLRNKSLESDTEIRRVTESGVRAPTHSGKTAASGPEHRQNHKIGATPGAKKRPLNRRLTGRS
jgi:hypothetical protein